ncbi:membrane protein [Streptomyces avermitilis]|uniref:Membrane protein n=1 Tax=Streptomyces avermitilis TaxID=33903 RepID=A0A4D4LSD1_STRAX|nr:membrane protein [Streptomyces avermitilis]GDY84912.1 membrane protein [Streptomyces avermitilis]
MGIESDQLVFDYLSRVGDLAQQRQLPSGTRMRLVSELRNEIDRRRAKTPVDSPAVVRRILARLGTPDEVVAAAGDGTAGGAAEARAAVPVQRVSEPEPEARPRGLRRVVPRPRPADSGSRSGSGSGRSAHERDRDAPSPPHLAGTHELGDSATQPDWWRTDSSPFGLGDSVPGFTGGVEIPEILKPPQEDSAREDRPHGAGQGPGAEPVVDASPAGAPAGEEAAAAPPRRMLLRPRLSGWSNPLLLLAAGLLVAGAVLGNWFALGLGWLIAYASRRLTPVESKWAVLGLPGAAAAAGIVWLWGRTERRWGIRSPRDT